MTSIGDNLGADGRGQLGSGYSLPPLAPPQVESLIIDSFRGGLNTADSAEDIPPDAASLALDVELSKDDALKRVPGIIETEDMTPRDMRYLFEQVGLDFAAELVAIDPPYLCSKSTGAMSCVDLSIGSSGDYGWRGISVAGKLLFSNAFDLTYTRDFGVAAVTNISAEIVAFTFAQVFGRVFAGGVKVGAGTYQALGIAWSSSADPIEDWSGAGSGAELLIADQSRADKVQALRSIGFDMLGILNRYSLWAGYPTGDANRPADFRPRVMSVGCVAEATAVTTPMGIIMLSDDGVIVYDTNDAKLISKEINPDLQIDYTQLSRYRATYDPRTQRYFLQTPFEIWTYDLPRQGMAGRWWRRSAVVHNLIPFAEQAGALFWDQVVGTWDAQTRQWVEMTQSQFDAPGILRFALSSKLGQEDDSTFSNFGTALQPEWNGRYAVTADNTKQYQTLAFELQYSSLEPSSITLQGTNSEGVLAGGSVTKTLPSTGGAVKRVMIYKQATGMNVAVKLVINSGAPMIKRLRQIVQPTGPSIVTLP